MLKEQIRQDMTDAMRAKDSRRLGTIRLLLSAIKQREIDEQIILDNSQVLDVIQKMLKQRRDSLSHFQNAGRQDLADQESYEIKLLEQYLPEQLTDTEIDLLITKAVQESGASSVKDMGKVMTALKPQIQGRANIAEISKKVKNALES